MNHDDALAMCRKLLKRNRPLSDSERARAEKRLDDYDKSQPIDNGHCYREWKRYVSITE